MVGAVSKLLAAFTFGIFGWINFSLKEGLMSSFLFVFIAMIIISFIGIFTVSCVSKNFYEEEENEMKQTLITPTTDKHVYS